MRLCVCVYLCGYLTGSLGLVEVLEGISVIRDITDPYDINSQQRFELEALMGNTKRNKIFEKNATAKGVAKARPTDSRDVRTRWIKAK